MKDIPNALAGKVGCTEEKNSLRLGCKTPFPRPNQTFCLFLCCRAPRNPVETSALSLPPPLLGNLAESSVVVK